MSRHLTLAALSLLAASTSGAQDTRAVVEPKIPPACATLPAALAPVADTTLADADEGKLDTDRIQRAIDGCGAGQGVVLKADGARRAFLSGPLKLKAGVALVVDSGAILFGSRDPKVYEATPGSCGVRRSGPRGCRPLILVDRAHGAAVMGGGTIDGRGWAHMMGQSLSWWDMAQQARTGPPQQAPRMIQTDRANDFTLYGVTLRNSPNFHVVFDRGNGFTAWGVKIHTPSPNARNTDGIDPAGATNVTITRSWILTGDDNVAIKGGNAKTSNVTVSHSHFYRGHGMSIGSETNGGVERVFVTGLTIDGADNGLRIKSNASRGGLVTGVTYENVCIRRTKNPIVMETSYTASPETTGTLIPHFRDVVLRNVRVDSGRVTLEGYDAARRLGIALDGVTFDAPAKVRLRAVNADVTLGAGATNLPIAGRDVTVSGQPVRKDASAGSPSCEGRFVPFPGR